MKGMPRYLDAGNGLSLVSEGCRQFTQGCVRQPESSRQQRDPEKIRPISSCRDALSKSSKPQAELGEGGLGMDHWDNGPRTKGLH